MKRRPYMVIFVLIIFGITVALSLAVNAATETKSANVITKSETNISSLNKATIVNQINQETAQIASIEKKSGTTENKGVIVYAPEVTARLYSLYQSLDARLYYLNHGHYPTVTGGWDGYSFAQAKNPPYSVKQVSQVLADLEKNGIPSSFLEQFHIFLLPYTIPDISGLGGAGFTLISAPVTLEKTATVMDNQSSQTQLAVTLDHEIGHHVHMSFMPTETSQGKAGWRQYLTLRGGSWHGPGKVNTEGWSNSSEETFAEDFRMLFGSNQPYYGDVALGDPRDNPKQAQAVKNFIKKLGKTKIQETYSSPWIPDEVGLDFWKQQKLIIPLIWGVLGVTGQVVYWNQKRSNQPSIGRQSIEI